MRRALGEPASESSGKVQNAMGATFDQNVLEWHTENTRVLLKKRRSSRLTEGSLYVEYKPIAKKRPRPAEGEAPF